MRKFKKWSIFSSGETQSHETSSLSIAKKMPLLVFINALSNQAFENSNAGRIRGNHAEEGNLSQDSDNHIPLSRVNAFGASRNSGDNGDYLTDHTNGIFLSSQIMTFIQGMGGLGKTIVSAFASSRSDVLHHFHDGTAWIKIGQRKPRTTANSDGTSFFLSYSDYIFHNRTICLQLGVKQPDFNDIVFLPGDDAHTREEKNRQAMENAHQKMCRLLVGLSVLIVLDDLWNFSDAEFFCFATSHSSTFHILATTRIHLNGGNVQRNLKHSIQDCHRVVKLGPLKEEEAIKLLFNEAYSLSACSKLPTWSADDHQHALSIVQSCQCLPVAVRSSGRIIPSVGLAKLAQIMAERSKISAGNKHETAKDKSLLNDPSFFDMELYKILDRSFTSDLHGPVRARVLKVCFVSFATIFSRPDCSRPLVPVSAICKLWGSIMDHLESFGLQSDQGLPTIHSLILEMDTLGLIDPDMSKSQNNALVSSFVFKEVTQYRLHHDLLLTYARQAWKYDADLIYSKIKQQYKSNCGVTLSGLEKPVKKMIKTLKKKNKSQEERLHQLLVKAYGEKHNTKLHLPWDVAVSDDGYVYHYLIYHMIQTSKGQTCRKAFHLLKNEGFIRGRVLSLGIKEGVKKMMADVKLVISWFQSRLGKSESELFVKGDFWCLMPRVQL